MAQDKTVYRVVFTQDETVYELYARSVSEESLMGFIEVEDFVHPAKVLGDELSEPMPPLFIGVKRTYIPVHMLLRIDEMTSPDGQKGRKKDSSAGNVRSFPSKKGA